MRRPLTAVLLLFACLLGTAGVASAHAVLEASTPARGAQLQNSPGQVSFTFNEPVEASLGAVRVFDTAGDEVQSDDLVRPGDSPESVGATLPSELPNGLYTATYHVVSADAHPVSGGITFTIGEATDRYGDTAFVQGQSISELLEGTDTGQVTEVAFWFDRWIGYLAIALAVGALIWLLLVLRPLPGLPEGGERVALLRFRQLVLAAGVAGLLASLAAIIFQGAVGAGTSFWGAFGSGIPGKVIETRFGTIMLARAAVWAVLLGLGFFAYRGFRRFGPVSGLGFLAAALLAVSPALAGHASTRDPGWLLIPSDVTHVAAMAVWTGGLAAMLWILPALTRTIADPAERTRILTQATLRFSAIALVAVGLIGVSGGIQAILEVGSFDDLFSTQFGRAVAIKIALFAILIGLGAANRLRVIPGLVRRMEVAAPPGVPGSHLRRNLRAEAALVIAVLGVTAALVSYPPPDTLNAGPVSGSVEVEGSILDYTIEPARTGSNEVHLYVFDDRTGAPVDVRSMDVSFSLPDREIAPIEAETRRAGPGHYLIPAAMLGVEGDWLVEAAIRISAFEEPIARFEVEIE